MRNMRNMRNVRKMRKMRNVRKMRKDGRTEIQSKGGEHGVFLRERFKTIK